MSVGALMCRVASGWLWKCAPVSAERKLLCQCLGASSGRLEC